MELEMNEAVTITTPFVTRDMLAKNIDVSFSTTRSEDQTNVLKRVNKSNNMKRRYRGKRKPKRKENRRRARPGRSRSGFLAIGAPFNNNEFLINQRDTMIAGGQQIEHTELTEVRGDEDYNDNVHKDKEQSFIDHRKGQNHLATSLEMMSKRCGTTCCGQGSTPHSTSSRSTETSDYESLHSPTESSSGSSNHWQDEHAKVEILNDELFDVDFAMRNFEADYSAHQREMKEQLMNLPKQQLEMRCSLLMDQLKDLEERSRMMSGVRRINELELELESLREENRRLRSRGVAADSLTAE